jgi:hypothetical protein
MDGTVPTDKLNADFVNLLSSSHVYPPCLVFSLFLNSQVFQARGKAGSSTHGNRLRPLDLGKGNGTEPILDLRSGTLRWIAFSSAKQNCAFFKPHLQFSTHAGIAVILHLPAKILIGVPAAEVVADN